MNKTTASMMLFFITAPLWADSWQADGLFMNPSVPVSDDNITVTASEDLSLNAGNQILLNGRAALSDRILADFAMPFSVVTNGIITIDPTNGFRQGFVLDGSSVFTMATKASTSHVGEVFIYLWCGSNPVSFDTNTIDFASTTNLIISSAAVTELVLKSPFLSSTWRVTQPYIPIDPDTNPDPGTLTNDLVFYATFDEDANDLLGLHPIIFTNNATFVGGKIGSAISFNGVQSVAYYQNPVVLVDTDVFTVAFWEYSDLAYPDEVVTYFNAGVSGSTPGGLSSSTPMGIYRWADNQAPPRPGKFMSFPTWTEVSDPVDDLVWNHVIYMYDGAYLDVYINGLLDASTALSFSGAGVNNFALAWNPNSHAYEQWALNGLVDEFAVWDRLLTVDEIAALYNSGEGLSLAP